jgi:hypothetical protein
MGQRPVDLGSGIFACRDRSRQVYSSQIGIGQREMELPSAVGELELLAHVQPPVK